MLQNCIKLVPLNKLKKKTLESDVGNYIVEETWKKTKKKKRYK